MAIQIDEWIVDVANALRRTNEALELTLKLVAHGYEPLGSLDNIRSKLEESNYKLEDVPSVL